MLEVKTDALEASFEALEREDEDVAALRGEVAALKARVDAQAVAGARPALSGAKSEASPFVERYLRKGLEAGVELKAVSGATDAAGGYAVPQEIDAQIDRALTAISPIRAIANVVRVGSAGYRKLVTTGGTESGLGRGDRGAAGDRHAGLQRDRAAVRRALRQSGGEPGDARRCGVRRRGLAGARDRDRIRPGGRARPSSRATGPTSRRASSPRRPATRRMATAISARCSISRRAWTAASRRAIRRTS